MHGGFKTQKGGIYDEATTWFLDKVARWIAVFVRMYLVLANRQRQNEKMNCVQVTIVLKSIIHYSIQKQDFQAPRYQ